MFAMSLLESSDKPLRAWPAVMGGRSNFLVCYLSLSARPKAIGVANGRACEYKTMASHV